MATECEGQGRSSPQCLGRFVDAGGLSERRSCRLRLRRLSSFGSEIEEPAEAAASPVPVAARARRLWESRIRIVATRSPT